MTAPSLPSSALPDAARLAELVSDITDVICGASFAPCSTEDRGLSICGQMVMLPIVGPRDIRLILSCDGDDARALASAMLGGTAPESISSRMVDDAIAEFLNMIAGRIQTALSIDQPLGPPVRTSIGEVALEGGVGFADAILLKSTALGDIKIWIYERKPNPKSGEKPFRSLVRKVFGWAGSRT